MAWIKGKKHTEETKRKIGETQRRIGNKPSFKDKSHSEETKRKLSLANTGKHHSEETKRKIGLAHIGMKYSIVIKRKHTEEFKRKMSERLKGNKINLGRHYTSEVMQKILRRLKDRPTSLERKFQEILYKYNLLYRYVGDGSFLIGFKNPDFVNINGEKICIEVANRYHHKDPYKENRIKHFADWGWKCIVFFEDEIDEKNIVNQLK